MTHTRLFALVISGSLAVVGACSHQQTPAEPYSVTGQAGTNRTGVDANGNPVPGTATGSEGTPTANPYNQPGMENNVTPTEDPQKLNQQNGIGTPNQNRKPPPYQTPDRPIDNHTTPPTSPGNTPTP